MLKRLITARGYMANYAHGNSTMGHVGVSRGCRRVRLLEQQQQWRRQRELLREGRLPERHAADGERHQPVPEPRRRRQVR